MTRNTLRFLLLLCSLFGTAQAEAGPDQDLRVLSTQAQRHIATLAGQAYPEVRSTVEMGAIDARLRLSRCERVHFFLPPGERLFGRGTLGARCEGPAQWTLYLAYRLDLSGPALVARHPLASRQPIHATDLELREVVYDRAPGEYFRTELPDGSLAARPIAAGQALTHDLLLQRDAVQAGRKVRVLVRGAGYQVSQEGVALNNAKAGAMVRVRTPNGRIVQGHASADGQVIVQP